MYFLNMVNTRDQASQKNQPREDEMDDFDDNAIDLSLPGIGTRTFEVLITTEITKEMMNEFVLNAGSMK